MEWNLEVGKAALERMKKRASCRVFAETPIAEDVLKEVLEIGLRAASGGNLQPYSIIVVKEEKKKEELAKLCGGQMFMANAPVNLIFLVDFHKLSRIAFLQKAPFTSERSYMPFLIALEDVMCAAQSIETAAWQLGIGSVYIGTVNEAGKELAEIYNLPKNTYPVVILTMGYPKNELQVREKLSYDMMVFDERYPDFSDEEVLQGFAAKYGDKERTFPTIDSVKAEWIQSFKTALLTTFPEKEVEEIVNEAISRGALRYFQYVFGMHYHAQEMQEVSNSVLQQMEEQNLHPFKPIK